MDEITEYGVYTPCAFLTLLFEISVKKGHLVKKRHRVKKGTGGVYKMFILTHIESDDES